MPEKEEIKLKMKETMTKGVMVYIDINDVINIPLLKPIILEKDDMMIGIEVNLNSNDFIRYMDNCMTNNKTDFRFTIDGNSYDINLLKLIKLLKLNSQKNIDILKKSIEDVLIDYNIPALIDGEEDFGFKDIVDAIIYKIKKGE